MVIPIRYTGDIPNRLCFIVEIRISWNFLTVPVDSGLATDGNSTLQTVPKE